jgi:protein SCO1
MNIPSTLPAPSRLLPWALLAILAVCADSAVPVLGLDPAGAALVRATIAATLIILAATRNHWAHDHRAFEAVGLAILVPAAWTIGPLIGLAAAGIVCAVVPSYAAWRFLPDRGQRGTLWAWTEGIPRGALAFSAVLALSLVVSGCSKNTAAKAPEETAYDLRGEVVSVDGPHHSLVVHHEEIKGFMPSMTMPFSVEGADMAAFAEGNHIEAKLIDDHKGNMTLRSVRIIDRTKESVVDAATNVLGQETNALGRNAFRDVGDRSPAFTLYDQDNRVVSTDQFKGKRIVLNFIYTRCPVATMCPAATARMMALQAEIKRRAIKDVQLVSISLDPAYDTPPVLKRYASERGIDTGNFCFLTGPEKAVRSLLTSFGVLVIPSDNLFKHTLSTVLIDRDLRIRYRVEGDAWTPKDFADRLEAP